MKKEKKIAIKVWVGDGNWHTSLTQNERHEGSSPSPPTKLSLENLNLAMRIAHQELEAKDGDS